MMLFCILIYLLFFTFSNAIGDSPASFCLCTMKHLLEQYALYSVNRNPPRYYSIFSDDIGFFVKKSSVWIPVNNATWLDLATMINEPKEMYDRISIDGKTPVRNGLLLNGVRSAHLTQLLVTYYSIIDGVNRFHENVIKSRTQLCLWTNSKESLRAKSSGNDWKHYF